MIMNQEVRRRIRSAASHLAQTHLLTRKRELVLLANLRKLKHGDGIELARELELSPAYLSDVRLGRRDVSESLAQKLSKLK